jgi:hypothetical protein
MGVARESFVSRATRRATYTIEIKTLSITGFYLHGRVYKRDMSDRSIYWSVTINNPNEGDEEAIANARQRGWIVEGQKECVGTPHYQLCVNTRTQQRFTALKKAFPRGHIEAARNPKALKQYVHKEETRVAELPNSEKYLSSQKQAQGPIYTANK